MASVLVTLGVSYALLKRFPIMPLITAVIVVIFGSLTLVFHDETLIKIKPTALYVLFGAALFVGLWLKKPLLKILFDGALHVTEEGWRKLTWRWAFFFLGLAILNEIVWRTQTTDLWVKFKTFGFLPLTLLFALAQAPSDHEVRSERRGAGRRALSSQVIGLDEGSSTHAAVSRRNRLLDGSMPARMRSMPARNCSRRRARATVPPTDARTGAPRGRAAPTERRSP